MHAVEIHKSLSGVRLLRAVGACRRLFPKPLTLPHKRGLRPRSTAGGKRSPYMRRGLVGAASAFTFLTSTC